MTATPKQRVAAAISQQDKAGRVLAACGHLLYRPGPSERGLSPAPDPGRCLHKVSYRFVTGLPRQCLRRPDVSIGGLGFCRQHGEKIAALSKLKFD